MLSILELEELIARLLELGYQPTIDREQEQIVVWDGGDSHEWFVVGRGDTFREALIEFKTKVGDKKASEQ